MDVFFPGPDGSIRQVWWQYPNAWVLQGSIAPREVTRSSEHACRRAWRVRAFLLHEGLLAQIREGVLG